MTAIAPIKSGSSQQSTPSGDASGSGGTTFAGVLAVMAAPSQDQAQQPAAASPSGQGVAATGAGSASGGATSAGTGRLADATAGGSAEGDAGTTASGRSAGQPDGAGSGTRGIATAVATAAATAAGTGAAGTGTGATGAAVPGAAGNGQPGTAGTGMVTGAGAGALAEAVLSEGTQVAQAAVGAVSAEQDLGASTRSGAATTTGAGTLTASLPGSQLSGAGASSPATSAAGQIRDLMGGQSSAGDVHIGIGQVAAGQTGATGPALTPAGAVQGGLGKAGAIAGAGPTLVAAAATTAGTAAGQEQRLNAVAGAAGQGAAQASGDLSPGAAGRISVAPGVTATISTGPDVSVPTAASATNVTSGPSTSAPAGSGATVATAAANNVVTSGTVLSATTEASIAAVPNTAPVGNGTSRSSQVAQTSLQAALPDARPSGTGAAPEVAIAATGGSAAQGEDLSGKNEGSTQGQSSASEPSSLMGAPRAPEAETVGRSVDGASTEVTGTNGNGAGAASAALTRVEDRPTSAGGVPGTGVDLGTSRPGGAEQAAPGQLGMAPGVAGQAAVAQPGLGQGGLGVASNGAQTTLAAIAPGLSPAAPAPMAGGSFVAQQAAAEATARDLPLAEQLATVLAPAAHQPDGSYQVNIRLQPEDLGVVNVQLRLESGTVNVSLHAEGDATGDMLRQNLGQLRQQLTNAGLTTGRFDVSTGSGSGTGTNQGGLGAGQERAGRATDGLGQDGSEQTETTAAASGLDISSATSGLLDVRL